MKTTPKHNHNCLKKIRVARGFTQVEVARKLGLSKRTLCSYEKGERRLPVALIQPLAGILDASANEILGIEAIKMDHRSFDTKLKRKLNAVFSMPAEDQKMVSHFVDHLLKKNPISADV